MKQTKTIGSKTTKTNGAPAPVPINPALSLEDLLRVLREEREADLQTMKQENAKLISGMISRGMKHTEDEENSERVVKRGRRSLAAPKARETEPQIVIERSEWKGQEFIHVKREFSNGFQKRVASATPKTWKLILAAVAAELE